MTRRPDEVGDAPDVRVRVAEERDVAAIGELIRELADYERARHEAQASDEQLRRALFGDSPHVFCHVAEVDGEVVGMALWFLNYSTWRGESGLYLEDLVVRERFRGTGLGGALMRTLARLCVERGYVRFEWWVLDWNRPAIQFYESIGARPMDDWTVYRLEGSALEAYGG
jgi:GNAT superfamily N-acetyltransferase